MIYDLRFTILDYTPKKFRFTIDDFRLSAQANAKENFRLTILD